MSTDVITDEGTVTVERTYEPDREAMLAALRVVMGQKDETWLSVGFRRQPDDPREGSAHVTVQVFAGIGHGQTQPTRGNCGSIVMTFMEWELLDEALEEGVEDLGIRFDHAAP